jgi:hypothetical protein
LSTKIKKNSKTIKKIWNFCRMNMNKCSNGTTKYSRKDMRSGLCKKDKIQCCLEHLDLLLTTLRFIFFFS